ncbi:unnamed protein product [Phaedon cochleariae]|uniref:MADF domain-containing protein n=1 Tax=Phaedon cochleariae TaxID=80249 RepID=A0A9P0GQ77_PHACE|nr:unnamed protein product [Phaedon cochleariae]
MQWTNELILEFIRLYKQEPIIWNPKYGLHRPGRLEISDAWRRIEANFSVECPIEELKRKKDSLMATYRSLRNKIKQKEIGSGSEDAYKPNWFAYEAMFQFLGDVYQPKISQQQDLEDMHMDEDAEDMENSLGDDLLLDADDVSDLILNQQGNSFKLPQERQNRKRKEPNINTCMCENLTRDECSLYSQLLAKKLRVFDDHTRMILMHEIDNFMFRAKLEQRQKGSIDSDLIGGLNSNVLEEYNAQSVDGFVTETIVVENATSLASDTGEEMATVVVKSEVH